MHAAVPLALVVALFSGGFLYKALESRMRARVLGQVRVQVDRRYRDIIPETLNTFNRAWNQTTAEVIAALEGEFNHSLVAIKGQLDRLTSDFDISSGRKVSRTRELESLESQLRTAEVMLRKIIEGTGQRS
jgi:hypothetical protein